MNNNNFYKNNYKFLDSLVLNNETFIDYLNRLENIAISRFEWINLPSSMDSDYLEETLYRYGKASILKDENYGIINTKCSNSGYLNIYDKPSKLNCTSYNFNKIRTVYNGLNNNNEISQNCILVKNNKNMCPTEYSLLLFAYRLYTLERCLDINTNNLKTPIIIGIDEKQRLFLTNLLNKYDGNAPIVIGDKSQLGELFIKELIPEVPCLLEELQSQKEKIWNEALTFLGINNIMVEKKERLVSDEVNSNNELINLNLNNSLSTRKLACKQFNELFGFTNTNKAIDVKVCSDLHNIIKNEQSIINDFKNGEDI